MDQRSSSRFSQQLSKLRKAEPLPALALGYLWGLLFCFLRFPSRGDPLPWSIAPQSVENAFYALASAELPFFVFCTLSGFGKFPRLPLVRVLLRSFLWGYGSFTVYLGTDQRILYFLYVIGCALTLLPLACLAKLSMNYSASARRLTWSDHLRYLYQCLYFWGLTLIILFFRGLANHFAY